MTTIVAAEQTGVSSYERKSCVLERKTCVFAYVFHQHDVLLLFFFFFFFVKKNVSQPRPEKNRYEYLANC